MPSPARRATGPKSTLQACARRWRAPRAAPDVAAFHRGAEAFRNAWLDAVANTELRHAIQRYSGQVQSVRFATLPDAQARRIILDGLMALLRAFEAGDGPAAQDRMLRFIYDAEDSYRRGVAAGLSLKETTMTEETRPEVRAEIRLPTQELRNDLPFYTKTLGFRLDMIFPADNPSVAVLSGHGCGCGSRRARPRPPARCAS
jgi:hypothetical protein